MGDDTVFGSWLTGGVPVSVQSFRRLHAFMGWMGSEHLHEVIETAGFSVSETGASAQSQAIETGTQDVATEKLFELAGRPDLERFLNEHVIDIVENHERYKALGIDFPSAIIFHGPPGCGKTFAVE